MQASKVPEPYVEGAAGEVIRPYLSADVPVFARDFYMVDRLAAQAGASLSDYNAMLLLLGGPLGAWDYDPSPARPPAHCFVVGPDDPSKLPNEVMTSPGTLGWNAMGALYRYDPWQDDLINRWAWIEAGCPKRNAYGEWANGGLPLGYVEESWTRGRERITEPGWPGSVHRGRHRRRG